MTLLIADNFLHNDVVTNCKKKTLLIADNFLHNDVVIFIFWT